MGSIPATDDFVLVGTLLLTINNVHFALKRSFGHSLEFDLLKGIETINDREQI